MKIVVIGGTGLIGSKLVRKLRADGHETLAAALSTGVNVITGEGLAGALAGAEVVVDVSNAPDWSDAAVMDFFRTSARNIIAAETAAGVGHHVALSVVGTDRLQGSGYFRAKLAQEEALKASPVPYTILRATQFFEFIGPIADSGTRDGMVPLPPVLFQPESADDVAAALADIAEGAPVNSTVELGGPERFRLDELVRQFLSATGDPRQVVTDARAPYYGMEVEERALIPGDTSRTGTTRFADWLGQSAGPQASRPALTDRARAERGWPSPADASPAPAGQSPKSHLEKTVSTPTGDDAFLHELELDVRTELVQVETRLLVEETDDEPTIESVDEEIQHHEAGLRALLGAIEAVENDI